MAKQQLTVPLQLLDPAAIGPRIRWLRKLRGLTQVQLGNKIGIDQTALSKLEIGSSKKPESHTLLRLAAALEANPNWILTGSGDHEVMDSLPEDDKEIVLKAYARLDEAGKASLLVILDQLAPKD